MEIKIDIPEAWINTTQPMINIEGENFFYSSMYQNMVGFQSDCTESSDSERYESQLELFNKISDNIRELLQKKIL